MKNFIENIEKDTVDLFKFIEDFEESVGSCRKKNGTKSEIITQSLEDLLEENW